MDRLKVHILGVEDEFTIKNDFEELKKYNGKTITIIYV